MQIETVQYSMGKSLRILSPLVLASTVLAGLFLRSWLLLAVPACMYVAFRLFIRREEQHLEARFGDDYRRYKQEVPALLPKWGRRSPRS